MGCTCKSATFCAGVSAPEYCLTLDAKRVLGNRVSIIVETCDFGRPYRDVISKHGYYSMEDLLHFSETWSVVLFQPFKATSGSQLVHILHDPDVREMWILALCDHAFHASRQSSCQQRSLHGCSCSCGEVQSTCTGTLWPHCLHLQSTHDSLQASAPFLLTFGLSLRGFHLYLGQTCCLSCLAPSSPQCVWLQSTRAAAHQRSDWLWNRLLG